MDARKPVEELLLLAWRLEIRARTETLFLFAHFTTDILYMTRKRQLIDLFCGGGRPSHMGVG